MEESDYHGWKDSWRVRNGACELVIVPQVGRAMYFATTGGKNVLWNNDALFGQVVLKDDNTWHNFGGDKVWPTEQDLWIKYTGRDGWPPPYYHDGVPQTAEPIDHGVRLTSPLSPRFGTRTIREFVMDDEKPVVLVRQWFKKEEGKPVQMTVWNIMQVRTPDYAILPLGKPIEGHPFKAMGKLVEGKVSAGATQVSIRNDAQEPQKIGTAPDADATNGWVAAVHGRQMIVQSRLLTKDAAYPDKGCPAEIYTAPARDGSYVELERLSPLRELKVGETLRDDTVWQLVELTAAQASDPEQSAAAARAAHAAAAKILQKPR